MNGIGRERIVGIAAQPTFGQAVLTATYAFAMLNAPSFEAMVTKLVNEAALGSSYQANDLEKGNRWATMSIEAKVDERLVPLLLKQRFDITSTTASGDVNAYEHTLAHQNDTNTWYTLFVEDSKRNSYYIRDVLFTSQAFAMDAEFVRMTAEIRGAFPVTWGGSIALTQPLEFVGRMAKFNLADAGSTVTATKILSANFNLTFGVNGEDSTHFLGNQDLGTNELTQDVYTAEVTTLESSRTRYDEFTNNTPKEFDFTIENTDRFISGTTITRPFIKFEIPYAKPQEYAEDAVLDDLIKETSTYLALDRIGEADAPLKITVRNSVASY